MFTPDLEEAPLGGGPLPGGRRPRRGSDIEGNSVVTPTGTPGLSVMDISPPSRCECHGFYFEGVDETCLMAFNLEELRL